MIPNDILFQVQELDPIGFALFDGLIVGSVIICVYFFWRYTVKRLTSSTIYTTDFNLPDPEDSLFEAKMAQILRRIIARNTPYPLARTARELSHDHTHSFLEILSELEQLEYHGKSLDRERRSGLVSQIKSHLQSIR